MFWIEDPKELIFSDSILPSENNSLEENMNSLTRIAIITAIPLMILDLKYGILYLVLMLMTISINVYSHSHEDKKNSFGRVRFMN